MPKKAKSRAQWKLFKAAASGKATKASGLSPDEALEALAGQPTPKGLPRRVRRRA